MPSARQRDAIYEIPYTVFPWLAVGATWHEMVNPVVPTEVMNVFSVPVAVVVLQNVTTGVEGNVDPNVIAICAAAEVDVPVPQVTVPRIIEAVGAVPVTVAGGEVPAPAPAAAVIVVESHAE
jgi:hypothetical protein